MHDFQEKNNLGFLEKQGNDAADYLARKNRELADLKSEYNLLQMLDLDQNLDRERVNAAAAQASAQSAASSTDGDDSPDTQNLATMGPVADYQKAKQQLELLKAQRAELSRNLRPAHPTIVALDRSIQNENDLIETLRTQSVDALKTRRDSIEIQIKNTENVIAEQQAKALDLSSRIAEFNRIKTKSDRAKEEYEKLLSSMTSVKGSSRKAKSARKVEVSIQGKASRSTCGMVRPLN